MVFRDNISLLPSVLKMSRPWRDIMAHRIHIRAPRLSNSFACIIVQGVSYSLLDLLVVETRETEREEREWKRVKGKYEKELFPI